MSKSILQYLVDNISKTMIETADPTNLGSRERCFKDLNINEIEFSPFTTSKKTGRWGTYISSKSRNFKWPDMFTFKTQDLTKLLKPYAGKIRRRKDIQTKAEFDALYYIEETESLVLVVRDTADLRNKDIELNFCHIPQSMVRVTEAQNLNIIDVSHPYVTGSISIFYR